MNSERFFGVKVHSLSLIEAVEALNDHRIIFTPNPEILLEAKGNKLFRKALKKGDLMLPDGHGLQLVSTLLTLKSKLLRFILFFPALFLFVFWKKPFKKVFPELIHGSDFMSVAVSFAEVEGLSVFFLGGKGSTAKKTANYFELAHPSLKIAGYSSEDPGEEAFKIVRKAKPDVLFVAYGAPKQELWIAEYESKLKSIHTIMAVGGSFDFWSGNIKRAPKFIRVVGLEWLWRLIKQPVRRAKRIWNALIIFPITSFSS